MTQTPKREIIFDTETTGFDPSDGHKLIEIGCVELIDFIPTGRTYHQYINPERDVPLEAVNVHGLTTEFLKGYPVFSQIVDEFLTFVGDATLVAHNAEFDMNFVNYQLRHGGFQTLENKVIDTLVLARQKFPGAPATLDALCKRYAIDNSNRTFHGALLDAELLTEVYIELTGGRQHGLGFTVSDTMFTQAAHAAPSATQKTVRPPREFSVPADEIVLHEAMLGTLKDALWLKKKGS